MVVAIFAMTGVALADGDTTPWAQGVSAETQAQANELFFEANRLFAEQAHAPAVDKYRAALALWDHPLIRFNLAVTLIRLDRVLEAADELDRAMRFGEAPFSKELYRQAQDYHALLAGRVGDVEATCDQRGVRVELDSKPWFVCPGTQRQRVLAGEHAVIGTLAGHLTTSRRIVVGGGAVARERVALVSFDRAVVLRYKLNRAVPWSVVAAGVAIAGSGLATWFSGRSQLDQYYNDLATTCPNGCPLSSQPLLAHERSGALFKGKLGDGLMIGGGVVALIGAALVFVNRPQRVLPDVEVQPRNGATVGIALRF